MARGKLLAVGLTALVAPVVAFTVAQTPPSASQPALTAPLPAAQALAGSESCRECHAPFYDKWVNSRHGLAMQPFSAPLAASLTPQTEPIAIRDRRYRIELSGRQSWMHETGADGEQKYALAHALGGKNVFYFLTPLDRGRLQVLPLAYDVRRQEWFDTTASAARGILGVRDEILDWRAPQLTFNTACNACHVSQAASNYDVETDTYHSVWAEPGINCEACHGPGGEHVRVFRESTGADAISDIRILRTKAFSVEQQNALCAPCHAKAMPLTNAFQPGDRYFDDYDLTALEDPDFYPDGRDRGENYTYTSWRLSPCAKSGQLSCIHCHTSSGRYRFEQDTNQACLPCHQSRVENASAHTNHAPGTPGNRCVVCHMPTTEFARMRRSDHSMRPPMPAATLACESPNACNLCHTDRDASWADGVVRQWRTRDYQASTLRAASLIDAARKRDWTRLAEMLDYLASPQREEIFATGLVRLLRRCEDQRKWPALVQALKDPSPLVRASAAEGLDTPLSADSAAALLTAAGDDYRLVRVRAAASLAALPADQLPPDLRARQERATSEMLAIVRARPDDSAGYHNLGNFYMARREIDQAVSCFERASRLLPDNAAPLVNASLAYSAAGRNDRAEDCLRRALRAEPSSAAANLNLGLLMGELGRLPEAEAALRQAFESDPQSAVAAYNLAVIVGGANLDEAVEWCRKAAQIRPDEFKYTHALAFYLRQRGDTEHAVATLRGLTDRNVPFADSYALLGQIYEQAQRTGDAAEVYQKAAVNAAFPDAVRQHFARQAARLKSTP